MPDRAQSELVGAILLLGLVVTSVGVAGAYAMGTVTQSSETPDAAVTGQIGTDGINLTHQGGDSLPGDDLRLIVRVNESETGLAWDDGTLSGDDVFEPGEEWSVSRDYAPDSLVSVRLVDTPSNTVLFRAETTVRATDRVESEMGGKLDAVDSEGEIEQGDVSTATSTPTSTPGGGDDECEYDDKHDGKHDDKHDGKHDGKHDDKHDGKHDGKHDDCDDRRD